MPYQSEKQRRFFEGCRSNPNKMGGKCPDKKTLNEFHAAEYHGGKKKAKHQSDGIKGR